MKRGELYLVYKGSRYDPKEHRVFVVVSRQYLIDCSHSSVICAPIYSQYDDIDTQVEVGVENGLKHESAVHCDELTSLHKSRLTDYVGVLTPAQMEELNDALRSALALE